MASNEKLETSGKVDQGGGDAIKQDDHAMEVGNNAPAQNENEHNDEIVDNSEDKSQNESTQSKSEENVNSEDNTQECDDQTGSTCGEGENHSIPVSPFTCFIPKYPSTFIIFSL